MKTEMRYNVRLEFITRQSQFLEVKIVAGSEREARNIAALRASEYLTNNNEDFIEGEVLDTVVDTCCIDNWQVEKI
jgi:hypothetical protein